MAEFCVDCWNKLNGKKGNPTKYVLSKEVDLCEGCGKYKRVIVRVEEKPFKLLLFRKR